MTNNSSPAGLFVTHHRSHW